MRKGSTTKTTALDRCPGERSAGRTEGGVPLVAASGWDDPEYGDAARERNPIFRRMHGLPPLEDGGSIEPELPRRKEQLTMRLDPDVIAFYRAEAKRRGARGA